MPRYYVLIKRKGSGRWLGAIPAKPGVSKIAVSRSVKRNLRPGFSAKVVTADALRRIGGGRGTVGGFRRGKRRLSASARRKLLANLRKARRARRKRR